MPQILHNNSFLPKQYPLILEDIINTLVDTGDFNSIILVVPTGRLQRYLQNKLIRLYNNKHQKPAEQVHILSLQSFVKSCFNKSFKNYNYRIISDAYRLSIIEEAVSNAKLKYFTSKNSKLSPTLLQRLDNIIFGLKEDGILPNDLLKDLSNNENINSPYFDLHKLSDIFELYYEYEKILTGKYLDYPSIIKLLIKKYKIIQDTMPDNLLFNNDINKVNIDSLFPDLPIIYFYGFSEFKNPEVEFMTLFSNSKVPFSVTIDYSDVNGPLFGNFNDTMSKLISNGFKHYTTEQFVDDIDTKINDSTKINNEHSLYLRRWLFNTEKQITNSIFSDSIKIIEAENRIMEVNYIAKIIKHLLAVENNSVGDICIVMKQPNIYTGLFREIFSSYNIPINVTDRYLLSKSPVVISIFSLLDIVLKGWKIQDIHRALNSKYLDFTMNYNDQNYVIDSGNLYKTARRLRISEGLWKNNEKYWKNWLSKAIDKLKNRLSILQSTEYTDELDIINVSSELASTQKAYFDFINLSEKITWQSKKYSTKEFSDILKNDIINKFKIRNNIYNSFNLLQKEKQQLSKYEYNEIFEQIEKDGRALSEFIRILDEMIFILNDREPNKLFSFDELVQKLKTEVIASKYNIHEKQNYGVTITSIEQIREIPYKITFLCGAVDGEFPVAYRPENFLGKELPDTEDRHIRSERIQFYQYLTNGINFYNLGEKKCYIFYPKMSDSEEFIRSPFIDALLKITDIKVSNSSIIKKVNDDDSYNIEFIKLNNISTKNEYYKYIVDYINDDAKLNIINDFILNNIIYIKNNINKNTYKTGILNSNEISDKNIEALTQFNDHVYSSTELDLFASCAFKFFIEKILRIKEEELPDTSLSPAEKGNVLHYILYLFYMRLRDEQIKISDNNVVKSNNKLQEIIPVKIDTEKYNEYKNIIIDIAKKELERTKFNHPFFELEELEILGYNNKKGILELWLQNEIDKYIKGWDFDPALFEFKFGMPNKLTKEKSIPPICIDNSFYIKGKIDRIEFSSNQNEPKFLIGDYKTSIKYIAGNKEIKAGKSFQMPLYILATNEFLKKYYSFESHPSGGVYYALKINYNIKKQAFESKKLVLIPKESSLSANISTRSTTTLIENNDEMNVILENSIHSINNIIQQIVSGYFPIAEEISACQYCKYDSICKINQKA